MQVKSLRLKLKKGAEGGRHENLASDVLAEPGIVTYKPRQKRPDSMGDVF